jgi:hypothetical protein
MPQDGRRTPIWQQWVNGVDRMIAPPLEAMFRHEVFGLAAALSKRAGSDFMTRSEKLSRRGLHTLNLPAASDVNRLLQEIAYVERQLRVLAKTVDDTGRSARPAADRATVPAARSASSGEKG